MKPYTVCVPVDSSEQAEELKQSLTAQGFTEITIIEEPPDAPTEGREQYRSRAQIESDNARLAKLQYQEQERAMRTERRGGGSSDPNAT
jgi:hypothetical protein